jgi:hypothetical protein
MKAHLNYRQLAIEKFEQRAMLAGSVVGHVNANTGTDAQNRLVLTGNQFGNTLIISSGTNPGDVIVAGGQDYVGRPTKVNGSFEPVTFTGVEEILLNLKEGNDQVMLTNISPTNAAGERMLIMFNGEDGNDRLLAAATGPRNMLLNAGEVSFGTVEASLYMLGGGGNDRMVLSNVKGDFKYYGDFNSVSENFGDDSLQIDGATNGNQFVDGYIDMSYGSDKVTVKRANFSGNFEIHDNGKLNEPTTTGEIELFQVQVAETLTIWEFAASSTITLNSVPQQPFSAKQLDLRGVGHNDVTIQNSRFSGAYIQFSPLAINQGDDRVRIIDSVFLETFSNGNSIELKAGNDLLSIENSTFRAGYKFDGGDGTDTFSDLGGNVLENPTIVNFEQ